MTVIDGDTRRMGSILDEHDADDPWTRESEDAWDDGLRQLIAVRGHKDSDSSSQGGWTGPRHGSGTAAFEETPWDLLQDWAEGLPLVVGRMFDHGLLDNDQEKVLAERIQRGIRASGDERTRATRSGRRQIREGQEAFDVMVRSNLRLVRTIAWTYSSDLAEEDVVSFGVLGLMRAAVKFDPERAKFSTYATWWIQQSIRRGIDDTERLIRIPVHAMQTLRTAWRVRNEMESTLGRPPSREEVAAECEKDPASLAWLELVAQRHLSMDDFLARGDQDQVTSDWWTILSDAELSGSDPFTEAEDRMCERGVAAALEQFLRDAQSGAIPGIVPDSIDRDVAMLRLRFGMLDGEPWTLERIGSEFGITRERVRQIINKLMENTELRRRLAVAGDIRLEPDEGIPVGEHTSSPPRRPHRRPGQAQKASSGARASCRSGRGVDTPQEPPTMHADEPAILGEGSNRFERAVEEGSPEVFWWKIFGLV